MVKEVVRTDTFIKQLSKFDKSYIDRIEKLLIKVINNPEIGKPMRYDRKGTREIYLKPFRLSYVYNNKEDVLYFLVIYHKNEQ